MKRKVVCIGAGPAGLTAAYKLTGAGASVLVLEADPHYVGGISRTVQYKGFHFDIGGHRFFSKSQIVEDLWTEILSEGMINRPRKSRIFYRQRFFSYPLKAFEALRNLGIFEAGRCMLSYGKSRLFPIQDPKSFEDWVTNQFGRRLFEIFFKTYTEKVWGMPCSEISADWAAQRIKGLSLGKAIRYALFPQKPKDKSNLIKTIIDTFRYPRRGPGMLWEAAAEKVKARGGEIRMGMRVTGFTQHPDKTWEVHAESTTGEKETFLCEHVVSSAPLAELVPRISPLPSSSQAAQKLKYRDFLTVALIAREKNIFDDNWIYIHDPSVQVGRIQNFKSWSPEMIPDPALTCYGLEYFCFKGDGLWDSPDEHLISLAKKEMAQLGLVSMTDVMDACVVRQEKAYPVYDDSYADNVEEIRKDLAINYSGFHCVGRNGMHKYNNQDHAMMTALLTAENILAGRELYDVWQVNQDAEYHEEGDRAADSTVSGIRLVPTPLTT